MEINLNYINSIPKEFGVALLPLLQGRKIWIANNGFSFRGPEVIC